MAAAFLREQQIKQAGPVEADPEQPVTTESQLPVSADVAKQANWWDSVTRNEAWLGVEDVGRAMKELPRNLISNMLGEVSDIAELVANLPLRRHPNRPFINVPGTSEDIVTALGGDPESAGFQIAGFIPTPGGSVDIGMELFGQAIALGAFAARRRGGPLLQRLNDFRAAEGKTSDLPQFNEDLWQQTGWYRGADNQPRFYLSDANSSVNTKIYTEHPRIQKNLDNAKEFGVDVTTTVETRLDDVLVHPELFELYPELAGLKVKTYIIAKPDGSIVYRNLTRNPGFQGGLVGSPTVISGVEMGSVTSTAQFHETILHEAQHVVQNIEGFATGTSSKLTARMLDELTGWTILKRSTALIDEGVTGSDDLFRKLVDEGFTEDHAKFAIGHNDIQKYQQALDSTDEVATQFLLDHKMNVDLNQHRSQTDMVHVLNFLYKNDVPEGAKMLEQLGETLRFEEIGQLGFQSYLNSAGEAEARLTGLLREISQKEIAELAGPPNPGRLADVTQELSVGKLEQPGSVTIMQREQPFTMAVDPIEVPDVL